MYDFGFNVINMPFKCMRFRRLGFTRSATCSHSGLSGIVLFVVFCFDGMGSEISAKSPNDNCTVYGLPLMSEFVLVITSTRTHVFNILYCR